VSDLIGVSWSHAITPQLVFNAFAKRVEDDYNTSREDRFFDYGLGLDYAWRSYLSIGLFYNEAERRSTLDNIEFDQRFYGIRLRSDLRSLLNSASSRKAPEPSSFPPAKVNKVSRKSTRTTRSNLQPTERIVDSGSFR